MRTRVKEHAGHAKYAELVRIRIIFLLPGSKFQSFPCSLVFSPAPCQRCSSCSLPPLLLPCRRNLAQRPKRSDGSVRASTARRRVGDALFIIVAHLFLWSGSFHWPLAPGVAVAAPPVPACGHWPSGRGWGCCSVEVTRKGQGPDSGWQLSLGQACLLPSLLSGPCVVSASASVLVQYYYY